MPASLLTVTPLTASGISHVGFVPSQFTGLMLWLDAAQIAGIASGTSLSAWTDSSASASHATQPSATSRPVYIAEAQNGNGVVSYTTGVAAFLVSLASQTQPFSFGAALMSRATNTTGATVFDAGSSFVGLFAPASSSASFAYFGGSTLPGSQVTTGQWVTITGIVSGSSTTFAVSRKTFFGDVSTTNGAFLNIGTHTPSSFPFNGQIGEILFYNRSLSEANRLALENYLQSKWSTA